LGNGAGRPAWVTQKEPVLQKKKKKKRKRKRKKKKEEKEKEGERQEEEEKQQQFFCSSELRMLGTKRAEAAVVRNRAVA
jgi:hypothetical protein